MDKGSYPSDPARAQLRASDAEREQIANLLRENFTDGRLTLEELQERLERAYTATTVGELQTLTNDLPVHAPASDRPAVAPASSDSAEWKRRRDRVTAYVLLMLFLIAIWAASDIHSSFWPIWPIIVGAFFVARDVLGLSRSGSGHGRRRVERDQRRDERDQRRIERHQRRMDRRFGPRNDEE